jgi:hypothetical protein
MEVNPRGAINQSINPDLDVGAVGVHKLGAASRKTNNTTQMLFRNGAGNGLGCEH